MKCYSIAILRSGVSGSVGRPTMGSCRMAMGGLLRCGGATSARCSAGGRRRDLDIGFGLLEFGQTDRPTQPADTAVLIAAFCESVVQHVVAVGPYRARVEVAADPARACAVVGEDPRREPELGGVGPAQQIGLVFEYLESAYGCEDLLLHQGDVQILHLEQARPIKRSRS